MKDDCILISCCPSKLIQHSIHCAVHWLKEFDDLENPKLTRSDSNFSKILAFRGLVGRTDRNLFRSYSWLDSFLNQGYCRAITAFFDSAISICFLAIEASYLILIYIFFQACFAHPKYSIWDRKNNQCIFRFWMQPATAEAPSAWYFFVTDETFALLSRKSFPTKWSFKLADWRAHRGGLGFPDFAHRRFLDSMQCLYQIAFSMVIHRRFQPFKVWGVGQPETAKFIVCLKCANKRIDIRHTHTFRMLGKGTSMVWYILACRDGEIVWDASFFWVDGSLSDGRTFVFKPLLHDNGYHNRNSKSLHSSVECWSNHRI